MITRSQRIKLLAFVVIAVFSVVYVAVNYAGMGRLFGAGGYVVTARFEEPGGVFVGSEVTYRGVAIGSVSDMRLTDEGLAVDLRINEDAPRVPQGSSAAVANRSPIGEQYVDLRPESSGGPYLSGGDTIPSDRTSVPVSSSEVLRNLNRLVNGIDTDSIRTLVDEAYKAFAGTGDDLQQLLDTANSFSATALEHSPQTKQLLDESRTVLQTQRENDDELRTFANGLVTISEQLKDSDSDLRTIIDQAPPLSDEISRFLRDSGTDLSVMFANLLTTSRITSKRTGSIETLLTTLPVISAQSTSRAPGGRARLGLVMNLFNPHSCTKGYDTKQRPATDVSEQRANTSAYCAEPPGSQTGVRGAQNAPMPDTSAITEQGNANRNPGRQDGQRESDKDVALRNGSGHKAEQAEQAADGGLPGMLRLSRPGKGTNSVATLLGSGG